MFDRLLYWDRVLHVAPVAMTRALILLALMMPAVALAEDGASSSKSWVRIDVDKWEAHAVKTEVKEALSHGVKMTVEETIVFPWRRTFRLIVDKDDCQAMWAAVIIFNDFESRTIHPKGKCSPFATSHLSEEIDSTSANGPDLQ